MPKKSFTGVEDLRPVSGDNQRKAGGPSSKPRASFSGDYDSRPCSSYGECGGHIKPPKGGVSRKTRSIY